MKQEAMLFATAIGLQKPWYISKVDFDAEKRRLDIYVDFEKGSKFEYEGKDTEGNPVKGRFGVHDTRKKTWRHLNFFEHECYLHCRVPRVKLDNGKVKTCNPPFSGLNNGFTQLFEALLLQLCKSMPIAQVSNLTNESEHKLWEMLDRYIIAGRKVEVFADIKSVGVDETAKAKGHNYITIFADLKKKRVIYVTEGKDNTTVKRFVKDLEEHGGIASQIKEVSCDLSRAFIKGVGENLPEAEITFDKFHVVKILNTAVDKVRRQEIKTQTILKNARYVVLKNPENLTKKQKKKLEELQLSKLNLKTMRAMHIRENFQEIYGSRSKEEFEDLLKKWYFWATHSRIPQMIKVAKTIKTHWAGIVSWYESRINNGILEGINSIVQAVKARARGYRTMQNFSNIIYLLKGDLNFSIANPSYPLNFT